jgi:2-oxoglutarate ferredoxin oxidoreductase subunit alpha
MSRVRGGNNFYQVRFAAPAPCACRERIDVLLAMDAASVRLQSGALTANGRVVIDISKTGVAAKAGDLLDVPMYSIGKEIGCSERYASSVAVGALAGMLGLEPDTVAAVLSAVFGSKGPDIVQRNLACAREGIRIGSAALLPAITHEPVEPDNPKFLLDGNEAVALGAVFAGCRFYSGYPMTPSTTIMEALARFSAKHPMIVEQAEDEIAAINMVIGASFAGVRAMTATSGGGFALMTEGISLAAMTETPVVIVNGQRPAPATGLPTRTEQADLDLVLHAGHGEFARVVYAPGSIEEAFELTVRAFDVSERFQIPVIILTDQYLADMVRSVNLPDAGGLPRDRHLLARDKAGAGYRRFALTDSGVSPRAIPSGIDDVIYIDSDEHTEEGHITEDGGVRGAMVDKRFSRKMKGLAREIRPPVCGRLEHARTVLIGFGSTMGAIREISESMDGVGCIHLPQVWPFPAVDIQSILANAPGARTVTVENNAGGQLARLIRRETGIQVAGSILKYDGRPFTVDELRRRLEDYNG